MPASAPCSRCQRNPRRPNQRYCKTCHAAWMREKRPRYSDLTPDQKQRHDARSMARVYRKRGKLKPQPCERCGLTDKRFLQMHHDDYSKPLAVRWLCVECHREYHNSQMRAAAPSMDNATVTQS